MSPTKRLPIFDVAKALLILLVFWFHVPQIYIGWYQGTDPTIVAIDTANTKLFVSFFMVAFFIISGYFLNTTKSLWEATKRDFLTIIVPAILISVISNFFYTIWPENAYPRFSNYLSVHYWTISLGYWFLTALFIAKFILQMLVRYVKKTPIIITISMCLCVVGVLMKIKIIDTPDYVFYQEALLMSPMILLGYICKTYNYEINRAHLGYLALGYVITIALLWAFDINITGFKLGASFSLDYIPMALWLGTSGTALILYLASWLEKSKLLNLIGKLTLPMFCLNFVFIEVFVKFFMPFVNRGCAYSWLYVVSAFVCSTTFALGVSILLDTKYLRWILGRWDLTEFRQLLHNKN